MNENVSRAFELNGTRRWESVPDGLQKHDQWVVQMDKDPKYPSSGWQKEQNQLSFEKARKHAISMNNGIGFILNEDGPFVVIDLDDVGPPTNHNREVMNIIEKLSTYTEVSRSGTGVHLVCRGERLPEYKHKGSLNQCGSIEVYDSGRHIVFTGDLLGERSEIAEGGQFFRELQREYLPEDDKDTNTSATETDKRRQNVSIGGQSEAGSDKGGPTVDQIKRTIDAYAADGSDKAPRTKELWESSGTGTYESPSEADLAFASDLAFWCRENATLMYRCIRRSSRYRSKWDEVHYSDGSTYAEETIGKAIDTNYDQFSGRYVQ